LGTREFRARRVVRCTPERAFAFVADHRNVTRVLEGVTRWRPIGRRATGVGARFDVEMRTFGIPLGGVLVLDIWQEPWSIGWRSEAGVVEQRGLWTFSPHPEGVEVELRISYRPPMAALGNLLAGRVDGLVRRRLEDALEAMAGRLEDASGR
jgi:ribosome-associated toxin RatA of RatAB toxin-antitoxin module